MQSSPTSEAPSFPPETSGELSELSPESLTELSMDASESLAEGSEEATQKFEALLDLCPDIMPQRVSDARRPLRVNMKKLFKATYVCYFRKPLELYVKMILKLCNSICAMD